jgi:hypothetical protein
MKVEYKDSFFSSLASIRTRETWWYRSFDFFVIGIPNFIKNVWKFRKVLWNHRWWDYRYTVETLRTSIEIMEKDMHHGTEVRESRDKKIAKMQRAIQIMKNIENDSYLEMAEKKLGKEYFLGEWKFKTVKGKEESYELASDGLSKGQRNINRQLNDLSNRLETEEWNELWQIFKGQDYKKFKKDIDFNEQFDGTGLRGWWD